MANGTWRSSGGGTNLVMSLAGPQSSHNNAGPHVFHGTWWRARDEELTPNVSGAGLLHFAQICPTVVQNGYVVSASSDGTHETLYGVNPAPTLGSNGAMNVYGNFRENSGNETQYIGTASVVDGLAPGEWANISWEYERVNGQRVICRINGIVSDISRFTGGRQSPAIGGGTSGRILFVGGSDHNNFTGKISVVGLWDVTYPDVNASLYLTARRNLGCRVPTEYFDNGSRDRADFFCYYTQPMVCRDRGYHRRTPTPNRHQFDGTPRWSRPQENYAYLLPTWVTDSGCPLYISDGRALSQPYITKAAITVPSSLPSGFGTQLAYDDFTGPNVDFLSHPQYTGSLAPDLGSTKGGSLGALEWQWIAQSSSSEFFWGRRSERAVYIGNQPIAPTWVDSGSANHGVMWKNFGNIGRTAYTGPGSGAALRVSSDGNNYWCVWINGESGGNVEMYVRRYSSITTVAEQFGPFQLPATWDDWCAAKFVGNNLEIYARKSDNTWVQPTGWSTITNSNLNTNTRCGLATPTGAGRCDWWGAYAAS